MDETQIKSPPGRPGKTGSEWHAGKDKLGKAKRQIRLLLDMVFEEAKTAKGDTLAALCRAYAELEAVRQPLYGVGRKGRDQRRKPDDQPAKPTAGL